jgi:uncharacterized protein YvpB
MPFKLVYYAQSDPKWKDEMVGFGTAKNESIGDIGCALTSVAMVLSGHGYTETPKSLNNKLKKIGGFAGSGIRWWDVNKLYPQVRVKSFVRCTDTPAPLAQIDAALAAGQPAIVAVDATAAPGYLSHFVVLIGRKGDDYLMLDPWPYQPDANKETYLMPRYSRGNPLQRSIMQIVLYENIAADGTIQMPGGSTTGTTTSSTPSQPVPAPVATGPKARVKDDVTFGLNIRSSEDTSSKANIIEAVKPGTLLTIIEPGGWMEIGAINQWIRVRTPSGKEGVTAAWYLERLPGETYPEVTQTSTTTTMDATTPSEQVTPEPAPRKSKLVVRVKRSLPVYTSAYGKGKVLASEKTGAKLVVVEDASKAAAKVGVAGKWLNVKASNNKRGFVDAGSVKLV